jgi:hypothetical protein
MTEPSFFVDVYANQIAFIVCACLGGIAHYLKKAAKGETQVAFHEWFGGANLSGTIYTLLVFFFIIVGSLAGDIINSQTGFWASLYTGFATGFAVDSGFNSDSKSLTRDINDVKAQTNALFNGSSTQQPAPRPQQLAQPQPQAQVQPQAAPQPESFVENPSGAEAQDKMKVVIRRKPTE